MAQWELFEWLALPTPSSAATVMLTLLLGTAIAIYAYATRNFGYWRRKGVPYLRPIPIAGNLKDFLLFRKHIGTLLHEVYTNMKDQPYIGMFFFDQPLLLVKDINIWKGVMHKDFEHFSDRGFNAGISDKVFGKNLLAAKGSKWKYLRSSLNPAFTVGKLKKFYELLEQKAAALDHYFDDAARNGTPCNITTVCARYTMDAIASVGFGIKTRTLVDDDDPLYRVLRNVFVYSKLYTIVSVATFASVPLLRLVGPPLSPAPLIEYLRRTIWGVVHERESAGLQGVRGDFLDLLMELRAKGRIAGDDPGDSGAPAPVPARRVDMDGDSLISQVFGFFSAGFDTSTATMSYALYHLAKDESMQEKLRAELQSEFQKHDGKMTYETLQKIEYLDMVVAESLRMYPPLPFIDRVCTKDYRIPGSDVVLNKGVFAFTSVLGLHRDPELYPEPERFDPERFSEENKRNIPSGAYLPFGDGGHRCIGMRLGLLQIKVGLAHIIQNYRVHMCADTPDKIEFDLHSFLIHPRNGLSLNFTRVSKNIE